MAHFVFLVTPAASRSHHARVGEGLVGNGGALPSRPPPLTSAAALRASACPQAPGGAGTGRCPEHRQVPGCKRQVPYAPYRLRCNNTRCKLFGAKRLGTRAARSSPAGEAGEAKPAVVQTARAPLVEKERHFLCRTRVRFPLSPRISFPLSLRAWGRMNTTDPRALFEEYTQQPPWRYLRSNFSIKPLW